MNIKSYISQDKKYLLVELENYNIINYQVEIVNNNEGIFLLPIRERKVNEKVKIETDISGKHSVGQYIKAKKLTYDLFLKIALKICDIHLKCEEYLLKPQNILIQNNTIFIDKNTDEIYMVYLPIKNEKLDNNIENLKKYIVSLSQSISSVNNIDDYNLVSEIVKYLNSKEVNIKKLKKKIELFIQKKNAENIIVTPQPKEVVEEVIRKKSFFQKIKSMFSKNNKEKRSKGNSANKIEKTNGTNVRLINEDSIELNISENSIIEQAVKNKKSNGYLTIENSTGKERIELNKEILLLGRMSGVVDYVLDSNVVGRVHARIENIDDCYYITDLGSKNGSYLNGARLVANEKYKLEDNSHIKLANINLYFNK